MAAQSKPTNTNHKRNWTENEALIAEGILSLIHKGHTIELFRAADISREMRLDPDVVQRHLLSEDFFSRNVRRISDDFVDRTSRASSAGIFSSVFLACVVSHRVWFEIEFHRQSHLMYRTIMSDMKSIITNSWPIQTDTRRDIFYRLYCGEVFSLLHAWIASEFADAESFEVEARLSKITSAFGTGLPNTILAAVLY